MIRNFSGNQRDRLIVAGLAILVLILGYWRMVPQVCGAFHDDAIYVISAKALAQGQGYRLIFLPRAPIQTKYPILYPALLAVIWKLWPAFPANLLLMKWLTLLCGAATVGLFYLYIIRFGYFSRPIAAVSALICATSPIFLYFSTQTLSEIPFALLLVLALWSFDAQMEEPVGKRSRQFWIGVLLALPFLCRSIGVTLVFAALFIQYCRGRPLRWMALGMATVMGPWVFWMLAGLGGWNRDPVMGYYTDYLSWWTSMGWGTFFQIISQNLFYIPISTAIVCVEGINNILRGFNSWVRLFMLFFLGSISLFTIIADLRGGKILPFAILFYLGLVMVWPWLPNRFLVPILPFLLGYLFQGFRIFPQRGKIRTRYLLSLGLCLMVAANLGLLYRYGKFANQFNFPYGHIVKDPASWTSYQDIFQWLRAHSQPDDVIAAWNDSMISLYTGRRAIRPFKIRPALVGYGQESYGSVKDLRRVIKAYKIRYLVEVPTFAFNRNRIDGVIAKLQQKYPDLLKRVYVCKDKRFAIFKFSSRYSGSKITANHNSPYPRRRFSAGR
jgi:4-amino-4-deoxy-L-arabinose transferase-like glycosyltransferase